MKMERKFVVYVAVNIINGYRYVGYTSNFVKRKSAHNRRAMSGETGCPKFHSALRKYGEDAFTWQILATFNTSEAALKEEIRLIKRLKPEYNVSAGGEKGNLGLPAWNRKPVTCLEDGNIFPSVHHAADFYGFHNVSVWDVCMTVSRSCRGLHFIFGNVTYGEKYRKRLIANIERGCAERRKRRGRNGLVTSYRGIINGRDVLGRKASGPRKNARKVMCVEDGKVFESASAAARYYDVCKSAVIELCAGATIKMTNGNVTKRKSVGGRKFKYLERGVLH